MITQRFRPVVWVAGVAFAATALYIVSLKVASERGRLEAIDHKIAMTRRDIRQLQTELGTRGSLRQLERWNGEVISLSAPTVGQFLAGENALANLDGTKLPEAGFAPPPVMVAGSVVEPDRGGSAVPPEVAVAAAPVPTRTAPALQPKVAVVKAKPKIVPSAVKIATRDITPRPTIRSAPTKAERVAMLDEVLVDRHTLSEITRQAASESKTKGKKAQ
jgi:hypothetical protein